MSDVAFLDETVAERIIGGEQDVPYGLQGLVRIVEELRDIPIPAGGDDVIRAMVEARQRSIARSRRLRVQVRSSLVATVTLTIGLAVAGDLPAAAQNAVHIVLRHVGIHVPAHVTHPGVPHGGDGGGTRPVGAGRSSRLAAGDHRQARGIRDVLVSSSIGLVSPATGGSQSAAPPPGVAPGSTSPPAQSSQGARDAAASGERAKDSGSSPSGSSLTARPGSGPGNSAKAPGHSGSSPGQQKKGGRSP